MRAVVMFAYLGLPVAQQRERQLIVHLRDEDNECVDLDEEDAQHRFVCAQGARDFLDKRDGEWEVLGHGFRFNNKNKKVMVFDVRRPDGITIMKEATKS